FHTMMYPLSARLVLFAAPAPPVTYTLSLHDALPISGDGRHGRLSAITSPARACLTPRVSGRGQAPGAVDAGVALEVRRDGRGTDLLAFGELRHRVRIQPEAAEVVGEVQHPALGQPRHRRTQQAHVLALHVEVVGAGGVGEGRRVAEDHVVAAALGFQPGQRVALHQPVRGAAHAV